jgi:hypothetical protein
MRSDVLAAMERVLRCADEVHGSSDLEVPEQNACTHAGVAIAGAMR